jgi:alcohol dehydrogenase (cytochrome c)
MRSHNGRSRALGITLVGALLATAGVVPAAAFDVNQERLLNADSEPQNWLTSLGNFQAHRYSRLDQINRDNVADLGFAFSMPIPTGLQGTNVANLEGPPLVIDGMMYLMDVWGIVYKVDVTDGRMARIQWITDPAMPKDIGGGLNATRGIAAFGNKIYSNLVDGRAIAIDGETGEIVWDKQVGGQEADWEFDSAEGFSAAPLAVDGKILVGQSKGDWGTRGYLAALDSETGEEIWRSYTVPGPGEPGHETWADDHGAWRTGGGALWTTGAYDPEQDVTIWGTANPVPMYDPEFRPGDNLYTNSAMAWRMDDGSLAWYFQYTPNESWDYDENGVHFLYDAEINGETRKVVGHYGRNGFFYQLDRTNGQFINATQWVSEVTWTAGIDPKTGKPVEYDPNLELQTYIPETRQRRADNPEIQVCPSQAGGVRWQPPAYNPETHLAYIAGSDACSTITAVPEEPLGPEGGNPIGTNVFFLGGTSKNTVAPGLLAAIDVTTGELSAKASIPYHNLSGVLATAGGLIFTGHLDGTVAAHDATTLEQVWGVNVGISLKAPPIAYAIGDKQYIAIMAGGAASPYDYPELDTMREGSMLFVFTL